MLSCVYILRRISRWITKRRVGIRTGKGIFERIRGYPGRDYGLYFPVERSCADEETGRGRGCWRTERERRRGKFRLVSLRFNRNPVRQHAGGDVGVYMVYTGWRTWRIIFSSRSQILNNPSVGKYVKYPKRLSTVCIVTLVPRNPWHGYFYAPRFLFVLQSLCIKYGIPSFFYKHFGQIDFLNIDRV